MTNQPTTIQHRTIQPGTIQTIVRTNTAKQCMDIMEDDNKASTSIPSNTSAEKCSGAIQALRNTTGGCGGVYGSVQINVTKVHAPTLLALRGCKGVSNFQKKALRNTFLIGGRC